MTKIYVGNLPFSADEAAVRQLFEQHGKVDSVALINDRETGRSAAGDLAGRRIFLHVFVRRNCERFCNDSIDRLFGTADIELLPEAADEFRAHRLHHALWNQS